MKRMLTILFVLTIISSAAFAASVKLEVINSDPALNAVLVTNVTTGQNLFSCGAGSATCSANVAPGTKIKMLAQPFNGSPGFIFEGWKNNIGSTTVCGTQGICTFDITASSQTTAKFRKRVSVRVAVGTGTGTMFVKDTSGNVLFQCSNPAPTGCNSGILVGTKLRIEAVAGPNQQFQKFTAQTGDATVCTGQGTTFFCNFGLTQETSVVGNFIQIP